MNHGPAILARLAAVLILSLCICKAAQADNFADARPLYQSGNWQEAAAKFEQAAAGAIHAAEAHFYAGECLLQLGQTAAALEHYDAVRTDKVSKTLAAQTLLRRGEANWLAGNHAAARPLLETFLQQNPKHRMADYAKECLDKMSPALVDLDEYGLAIADLASAAVASTPAPADDYVMTEATPNSADDILATLEPSPPDPAEFAAALDRCVGQERDGRHAAALAGYAELLAAAPPGEVRQAALQRCARLYERLGRDREAAVLYRELLDSKPGEQLSAETLSALGWIAVRGGKSEQALQFFDRLHSEFPQSPQALEAAYWLAAQATDEGDGTRASQFVDWLLGRFDADVQLVGARNNQWGQALALKCQLLAGEQNWHALDDLLVGVEQSIAEGPVRARLAFWHAEAEFRLGDYDAAWQRYEALKPLVVGIDEPWVAMPGLRLAQLAARRQHWSDVVQRVREHRQEFPDFSLGHERDYLLGRARAGQGEMTAAREAYNRVLNNPAAAGSETAAMAQWMIGETFFHQHDYPRARDAYAAVMELAEWPEWQARAALQAGKCLELEQQWDDARATYVEALDLWRDSSTTEMLEARLKWVEEQRTR